MEQFRLGEKLIALDTPKVMAIVNITPDSFFAQSRAQAQDDIRNQIETYISQGADIIDIGAYSSRPGAAFVSADEEFARLQNAFPVIRSFSDTIPFSIDTFRADIVRKAFAEIGDFIVNDITAGYGDDGMYYCVGELHLPYIAMHMRGTPQTMQSFTDYRNVTGDIITYFAQVIERTKASGIADVIIDPGFGFSKTLAQNYQLLNELEKLAILDCPLLIGVSRKSMIYKLLGNDAATALNGTTALHAIALQKGANILRVHDVDQAKEAITIQMALQGQF